MVTTWTRGIALSLLALCVLAAVACGAPAAPATVAGLGLPSPGTAASVMTPKTPQLASSPQAIPGSVLATTTPTAWRGATPPPPAVTGTVPTPTIDWARTGHNLVSTRLVEQPLSTLSPEAQVYLEGREGRCGVAVVVPNTGVLYTANGDQLMSMASVVKVAVMVTVMDRAIQQQRALTERELRLLTPMITSSDNEATTALWAEVGGDAAVGAYLQSIGITDIVPNAADQWGASRASAKAVGLLFAKLAFGDILNTEMRQTALRLLTEVIPEQRWGVTAGAPDELPAGAVVGVKDGWYPAGLGWWVNSAGMLIPPDKRPAYAIAVLTRGQPSWEFGIATIEGVAARVHAMLH